MILREILGLEIWENIKMLTLIWKESLRKYMITWFVREILGEY